MSDVLLLPAGGAALLILAAVVMHSRKSIFWLAFLPSFVPVEYIDRYHFDLPAAIKWSPLICIVFAGAASGALLTRDPTRIPRRVVWGIAAMLACACLSFLWNRTSLVSFVVAQRIWVVVVAAIVALKAAYPLLRPDDLHALLIKAGILSACASVFQRLFIVPITGGEDPGDRVTGLFSVGYINLFFQLLCLGIALVYWLRGRRVIGWPPWAVLLLLIAAPAVGNQKAALPYLVLLVLFIVLRSGLQVVVRHAGKLFVGLTVLPALLFVVFTAIFDEAYERRGEESYARAIFSKEYVVRYLFGDAENQITSGGAVRRGVALQYAYAEIDDGPAQLCLGSGPGATSESRIPGATGVIARKYPGREINRLSLSMVIGDTGLLGVLCFLFLLATVFSARWAGEPREHKLIRETFAFLTLIYSVYGNMLNEPVFALLFAVVLYPFLPERQRSKAA